MDVVILTDKRYTGQPSSTGPADGYVDNLLLEDRLVADALCELGLDVDRRAWCDSSMDWDRARSAVFRTTWDYFDRWNKFSPWLDATARQTRLFNAASLVRWNLDKHYLQDLERTGVVVVPTTYVDKGAHVDLYQAVKVHGWSEVVIKPAIAGGAVDTYLINLQDDAHVLSPQPPNQEHRETLWHNLVAKQDMLVQPFLTNVVHSGEVSLVWIDGKVTHGVLKRAKSGDFRVQDDHGGTVNIIDVDDEMASLAKGIMDRCLSLCTERDWEPPLYARVDLMRGEGGEWMLSELEMVEPELWFRFCPEAAHILAKAIKERLDA